jgi:hypothetical protein
MRNRFTLGIALAALAALSACNIYWGDDDPCSGANDIAFSGLRNPQNGACESYGGGGCYDTLAGAEADRAPLPDWGECPSACEALSESSCLAAERCRAVYTVTPCPPDGVCDEAPRAFYGCWSIAPSGPAYERVACESLDAYECSRHNDCVGLFTDGAWDFAAEAPPLSFSACAAEQVQGCYGDGDCPAGWNCTSDTDCLPPPGCDPQNGGACPPVCYGVCEPPAGSCATIDCGPGWHCEEDCSGGACDPQGNCDSACTGTCVPDQNMCPIVCPPDSQCVEVCTGGGGGNGGGEMSPQPICTWECAPIGPTCADVTCGPGQVCEMQCSTDPNGGMGDCRPVCVPAGGGSCAAVDCGPGYHCEEDCAADGTCTATCVANQDPGACSGDVFCDVPPPACPADTTPGIRDGCWTGYCIPLWACGFMTP